LSAITGRGFSAGRQDLLAVPSARRVAVGPFAAGVAIAGSVALAALLRIPFLNAGLSPDEGGYAYVAREWAHGARLYGSDWVDRPQGLILAYRLLLEAGGGAASIRFGAVLFGCAITLLLGVAGWLLRGPWTGAAAAVVYAVVGVAPHLQGFTFNGELAAALPSTAAVVAALAWRRDGRVAWLVVGGALGAIAMLMKQSGFDGLLVMMVVVLSRRPGRWRSVAAVLAGAAAPLGLSAVHGALVGWNDYWYAVVGYKLSASSGAGASLSHRLASLGGSWLGARRDLAIPAAIAVGVTAVALARRKTLRIPLVWFGAAFLGFNAAALYWPHYYVQLLPPLALVIAVGATSLPSQALAVAAIAIVVGPAFQKLSALEDMSLGARQHEIPYYGQYVRDQRVARAVDRVARPAEPIYALDSEADLYFIADRPAAFPYLWAHPLEEIPGALDRLRGLLAGPGRPRLVIEFRSPSRVDPTGVLARIVARDYRPFETVAGVELLRSS
jgi:4-amino-4-deoxy-L-arabinose transferase-like glycosyltransferase